MNNLAAKKLFKELKDSANAAVTMTDKQISIISAAIEIFSKKGYAATSTSEIAKKANVAEGTIFHHYKTKKDLLLAIPEYLSKSSFSKVFLQDVINILESPYERFEDLLRALIENRRNFASTNISLIKVLFQEVPFHSELRVKMSQTILFPAVQKLVDTIDNFKARGQIIDLPSVSIVNFMFTTIWGYFFTHYIAMLDLTQNSEKESDYLIQYIMSGICTTNNSVSNNQLSRRGIL